MKTRILSFLLMLVMVVLAVPAFVLPAAAVEVPADYSTSWLANLPSVDTSTGDVTFPSDAWRLGYKSDADTLVPFGKYCSGGGPDAKLMSSTGEDQWGNGGYYSVGYGDTSHVAIVASKYVSYRYTAEYTGKATISVNALYMASGGSGLALTGDANSAFAIAVNGEVIWPENATYDAKETWYYNKTVAVNVANEIPDLNVALNVGDKVEFLFAKVGSGSWSHYGFDPAVVYTTFSDDVQLPYTSKWTECLPWVSDRANGVVTMPEGPWGVGRLYTDGTFQVYAYSHSASEDIVGVYDGGIWDCTGMFMNKDGRSRYLVVPGKNMAAVRYTAEYTGEATLAVSNLIVDAGKAVCVMHNGKIIWPANATMDASTWYVPTLTTADIASEIPDIKVTLQKGDALQVVIGGLGTANAGWGAANLYTTVTYTTVEGVGLATGTLTTPAYSSTTTNVTYDAVHKLMYTDSAWTPIQYDLSEIHNAGNAKNLVSIKRTTNGFYVQPANTSDDHNGGWASFMVKGGSWAPANYFSIPANVATGWRYSVPSTGVYTFNVDALKQGVGCTTADNVQDAEFAVYVNNQKVWPAGDAWYALADANVDYAADANAAIGNALTGITLNAGDKVEFLLKGLGGAWNCVVLGQFSATQTERTVPVVPVVPEIENGSITLNDKFATNFFVDTEALPEGATNIGAYVNGEFVAANENGVVTLGGIAAKNLADAITVQPTYTAKGEEVMGETTTVTAADMLMQYVTDDANDAISNLAIATLNYAAAAQTFFGYNTENLANGKLSDAQKAVGAVAATDSHTVQTKPGTTPIADVYGVKLMLNDTVDVAIYFTSELDLTEGYEALCIRHADPSDDSDSGSKATVTEIVKVSEGLYKVIFRGFMPTSWNGDYEFSLVAAGTSTPVSEILSYNVLDYIARTQNSEAAEITAAMYALYSAAVAYNA